MILYQLTILYHEFLIFEKNRNSFIRHKSIRIQTCNGEHFFYGRGSL